ncbi:MAG: protein kinase, partial [bacterium]|nr:protein kinase [bacterium]
MNISDSLLRQKRILNASHNEIVISLSDDYGTSETIWTSITHIIAGKLKRKIESYMLVFFIKNSDEAFIIDSTSFNFKNFLSAHVIRQEQKFLQALKIFVKYSKKAFIDWPVRDSTKTDDLSFIQEFKDQPSLIAYCHGIRENDRFQEKKDTSEIQENAKTTEFKRKLDFLKIKREKSKVRLTKARDLAARGAETQDYDIALTKACREIDEALESDPGFLDGWLFKADICSKLERSQQTLDALQAVIERIPENKIDEVLSVDIYIHLADLYAEIGNHEKEAEMLQNFFCISPSEDADEEILNDLSACLGAPDNSWYANYIKACRLCDEGNYFMASEAMSEVLSVVDLRWGYHWMGIYYESLGNLIQAEDLLKLANEKYPAYSTYMELGFMYEKAGQFAHANDAFRQATEFMPYCPFAYISAAENGITNLMDNVSTFSMIMKAIELDPYGAFVNHAQELVEMLHSADAENAGKATGFKIRKIGDSFDGKYPIEDIFKGGMGIVYKVTDSADGKTYAMKTFQDKFLWNDSVVKMFYHEAEIWIRLGVHQNIVQAIKIKDFDGKPYVFLEYIEGTDLEAILKYRQLDAEQILDYATQFCSGMSYAYRTLGVIHQDIKPSNCMLTNSGILKITDFGLGKIFSEASEEKEKKEKSKTDKKILTDILPSDIELDKSSSSLISDASVMDMDLAGVRSSETDSLLTEEGERIGGTIPYMAPELFTDEGKANARTDIYSFGAMLYEMITGDTPFGGDDAEACIIGHLEEIPEDPCIKRPDIPKQIANVALRCLEKNPDDRYGDFSEILAELNNISSETGLLDYERSHGDGAYDTLEKMIYRGESLMVLEKYGEAAEIFTKTLAAYPMAHQIYAERAECYRVTGRYAEALHDLKNAIKNNPKDAKAYSYMGSLYVSTKRFKEAHRYLFTSSKLNPSFADVWIKLGTMYDLVGDSSAAIKYYDNALSINPKSCVAWNNKGNILLKDSKYFEALSCYTKAIDSNPRYQLAWLNQGTVKQKLHLHFDAIKSFRKCLELNPNSAKAITGICISLIKIKAFGEAYRYFDSIEALSPANSYFHYLKSTACYELNKFGEAIDNAEQAVAKESGNIDLIKNLLSIYLKMNECEAGSAIIENLPEEARKSSEISTYRGLFLKGLQKQEAFSAGTSAWFTFPGIREYYQTDASECAELLASQESMMKSTGSHILSARARIIKEITGSAKSEFQSEITSLFPNWKLPDLSKEKRIYSEIAKLAGKKKKGILQETFGSESSYKKAIEQMAEGDYIKALQTFQKILPKAWGEIDIWWYAAICQYEIGKPEGAAEMVSQGLARSPIDYRFWLMKAFLYKSMGYMEQSFNTFVLTLAIMPSSSEAIFEIISILLQSGNAGAGKTAYLMIPFIERLAFENSSSLFTLAFLYIATGRTDKASEALDQFLSFYPPSDDSDFLRIYIDIKTGNLEQATGRILSMDFSGRPADDFSECLSYLLLGYIKLKMKKYDEARTELNKIPQQSELNKTAMYYRTIAIAEGATSGIDLKTIYSNFISESPNSEILWEAQGTAQSMDFKTYGDAKWAFERAGHTADSYVRKE